MLHGRREECALLDRLTEGARGGSSGVLVIRGEAGVGKSALLEYAYERAEGMSVLRTAGVQSESELPFAALHQMLRPVLDRVGSLPEAQEKALGAALGIRDGVAERFLVSIAVLEVLAALAEERPVLCLIDDAQWLDRESADALVFAARRLRAEGIVALFAVRDEPECGFEAADLPELAVHGLKVADAGALLDELSGGRLSPATRQRLVAATEGNPLALIELHQSADAAAVEDGGSLLGRLPLSAKLEAAYVARAQRLPEDAQRLLLLGASEDLGEAAVVLRAARSAGIDARAVAAIEDAGLVRFRDGEVQFRHPLVRSAVYQHAGRYEREEAHRLLADALDPGEHADRRAWHRSLAALGVDEDVASELERTAVRAQRRAGYAAAARALERAAELSAADGLKARRLVAAADAAWLSGQSERARGLLERVERLESEPPVRLAVRRLAGVMQHRQGNPLRAYELLIGAAEETQDDDEAMSLLLLAAEACAVSGNSAWLGQVGQRACRLHPTGPRGLFAAELLSGIALILESDFEQGSSAIRRALSDAEMLGEPYELVWAGAGALYLGEEALSLRLFTHAADEARSRGALGVLPFALSYVALAETKADNYATARAVATEALELAGVAGQLFNATYLLSLLAFVAAKQGREAECRSYAQRALRESEPRGLALPIVTARWALGLLELALGHSADALGHLDFIASPAGIGRDLGTYRSAPDRVEAAVRSGDLDTARTALALVERWSQGFSSSLALGQLERCRALLAEGNTAELCFQRALAHQERGYPFERARTELAFGEWLRRAGRRTDAREHLRSALERFERLGADPWAERARQELRASGETARKRDPSTIDQLTPQEVQVAQLVALGLTNPEVAGRLFLSRKTVEYHLHKVYTKLGIASRSELARVGLSLEAAAVPEPA